MSRFGYIDLDCCYEENETIEEAMAKLESSYDVGVKLLTREGPGGWPVIRIIAEKSDLAKIILDCWDDLDLIDQIDDIERM